MVSIATKCWLKRTGLEAKVISEAYRLRLNGRLWWANLILVVAPAAGVTAATGLAAGASNAGEYATKLSIMAAIFAGIAAILTAIHKSMKCEEYQTECLRLSGEYRRIAVLADSALSNESEQEVEKLTSTTAELAASGAAPLPPCYITKAEKLVDYKLYGKCQISIMGQPLPDNAAHLSSPPES